MNNTIELTASNRFDAIDAETTQVLKGRVSPGSRDSYETANIRFLLWIFDNRKDHGGLVKPCLLGAMEAAHEKYRARRTKAGHPSKLCDVICAICKGLAEGDHT